MRCEAVTSPRCKHRPNSRQSTFDIANDAHPEPSKTRASFVAPDIARRLSSPLSPSASSQGGEGGGGRRAPRITEQPVDVVVRKHEPVTLRCSADGDPPPRITWFHEGKTVRDSATRMVLPEGQLFFLQVQHSRREQDTGLYWCTATNALGTARSRNASVELAGE
ncbi:hypothetical protein HPB50_026622 [Hyalomma asiaticum]|uniref:Uncharacterized protein n=1 Tax=Hyalomma asiaticum TaxID=266040 RepID=A0ACB7S8Z7_HYAAI|nr:hypothetical protein HPB50_026622 [Hyalomma asiaticum]